MPFLDQFSVLLLDMNGTFMFGEDRFGAEENFHATYRALGGGALSPELVNTGIRDCHAEILRHYQSPDCFDDFPSLAEALRQYAHFPESEIPRIEEVFTLHERGTVSQEYAVLLRRLSGTHQLGLLTNIWGRKEAWLAEFERAEISDVFACKVFSSDSRSIKPSAALFRKALKAFPADSRVLFIGDSLERDVMPAKAMGMATAWIDAGGEPSPHADFVLPSLLAIETFPNTPMSDGARAVVERAGV
jgi:putative hydrolase of the HAD superfamily